MLNKAQIIGHLGQDPTIRNLANGGKVANLSVATTEKWKDKQSGARQERTEWHKITCFGFAADFAENYLRKGSKVYVEGKLQTRKWTDNNGVEKYTTEINVDQFRGVLQSLDRKEDRPANTSQNSTNPTQPQQPPADDVDEEDIPF